MEEMNYKQTEVGLIPEDWESFRINDLFDIGNGYTPSKANPLYWNNGTIPWFRLEDIRKNGRILNDSIQHITPLAIKSGKLFPPGSYILSTTATIGEHALITVASLANQQFSILLKKPNRKDVIDTIYFFYYLYIIGDWCRNNINAGGLNAVNIEDLKNYELVVPSSLAEQHAIASALTSIDNLIASLDKQIAKTQSVKQGAMQQLIMGLNTEDVTWKPLGDVVNFSDGFPFDSSSFRSSGKYAVIRISDLSNYNVVRGDKYIEYLPAKIKDAQILGGGEILIAMSGSTGKVGYNKGSNFVVNQRIAIIRNKDNVLRDYLKHILLNSKFEENCFKQGTGIQNNIGKDVILDYLIPYPSIETQHRIASALTAIDDQISALEAKRRKYEMVKVGMMQQLLTGKIRLK